MSGIRIRGRALARVAAVAVAGLAALALLPGLLRAPAPPPLAGDVGLQGLGGAVRGWAARRAAERGRPPRQLPAGVIASSPHPNQRPPSKPRPPARTALPPTPRAPAAVAIPPPPPPPPPAPVEFTSPPPEPEPQPPAAPDDGSEEFAPH